MKCPVCGAWTLIKDTRKQDDNSKIRRYECGNMHTFKTVEHITKIIGQNAKQEWAASDVKNKEGHRAKRVE